MIPFIDSEQLIDALGYPELIAALRQSFSETVQAPRRHVHALSAGAGAGSVAASPTLLLMPVWQQDQQLGLKLVTVAPGNRDRGLPTVQALFILLDAATGTPLALMDGERLTLRRTAGASALASSLLSREDSTHLLIVGTGQLAPHMAVAHCAVRPVQTITIWGRDAGKVQRMMSSLRDAGLPADIAVQTASDLHQASQQADIICCATTSKVPLLSFSAVRPGTHIDLVGGFKPDMREADDALISKAKLFVDTFDGALAEAGDLVQPLTAGLIAREDVLAELSDLVTGAHPGRRDASEITLFKSVGTAIEDLCAAKLAWAALSQQFLLTDNPPASANPAKE